jgi:hypothetical protein
MIMKRLAKNIGPDAQPGDNVTLAIYDGPPGNEHPTRETIKAQNVCPYVFRSGVFGATGKVRGEDVCDPFHL